MQYCRLVSKLISISLHGFTEDAENQSLGKIKTNANKIEPDIIRIQMTIILFMM